METRTLPCSAGVDCSALGPVADITYEIGTDGQTLTISLPCGAGETYSVENPASDRLLLQERGQEGDKYRFLFRLKGNVTEKIRLKFSLHIGEMTTSMRDYSVLLNLMKREIFSRSRDKTKKFSKDSETGRLVRQALRYGKYAPGNGTE